MGNEHIPPVLLLMSFLGGAYYLFKNKKLPNLRFIILPISIFIGYLMLFFAPANRVKEKVVGKSPFDIETASYLSNFKNIFKTYFYYNRELLVVMIVVICAAIVWNKKIKRSILISKKIF